MVWNAQNMSQLDSSNHAAFTSPNHGPYGAPNHGPYSSPNHAAYSTPNHAAFSAPNHAAFSAPNHAAFSAPNHAASLAAAAWLPAPWAGPATGAGGGSGLGFAGGYGPVARSEYATPAALAPLPWSLDFAVGNGWPGFPTDLRFNPYQFKTTLRWQTGDWDPALRFWTLPFDPQLTEWLQDLNLAHPSVMVAREFAAQPHNKAWLATDPEANTPSALQALIETDAALVGWRVGAQGQQGPVDADQAWIFITIELTELVDLMRDDRLRYLPEVAVQSAQIVPYFIHLMGLDPAAKPWTMELVNCALAIANLTKMQYKAAYARLRPSTLCPGLAPPWGPPQHPAFPSGHSLVAHLIALFLLRVPGIAQRFGIFDEGSNLGRAPQLQRDFIAGDAKKRYGQDQRSPLLWLAWRVAKGRERLGLHYPSDSAASRMLAAGLAEMCFGDGGNGKPVSQRPARKPPEKQLDAQTLPALHIPTLQRVLRLAEAEWPLAV